MIRRARFVVPWNPNGRNGLNLLEYRFTSPDWRHYPLIRTLHLYLGRELAKIGSLALVAFTLVMTILAIIEPLRRRGLGTEQVISLFAYTLPVMFSLTLPIAALFAATIVYGRFAQDNELMACRASGVSTISLLKPALALGAIVTVASLVLSNYVTPQMARLGELAIRANVQGLLEHGIQADGYVRMGTNLIHADEVSSDRETLLLRGVVYTDLRRYDDIAVVAASEARVFFTPKDNETIVSFELKDPAFTRTGKMDLGTEELQHPEMPYPIANPMKEKAAFLDWDALIRMRDDPTKNREFTDRLRGAQRAITYDRLASDLVAAIQAGQPYDKLHDIHDQYVIRAPTAVVGSDHVAELQSKTIAGKKVPVEVMIVHTEGPPEIITAEKGTVRTTWSALHAVSWVSIELRDPLGVLVRKKDEPESQARRRNQWSVGQLAMPPEIATSCDSLTLEQIYQNVEQYTSSKDVLADVRDLRGPMYRRVLGDVTAEMHGRIAYSVSCWLMVALGAALGLVFRGGQLLSAFTISVIPAAIVIVMTLMGKELVSNVGVQTNYGMLPGVISIWSGIVLLAVANIVVYFRLMRQ